LRRKHGHKGDLLKILAKRRSDYHQTICPPAGHFSRPFGTRCYEKERMDLGEFGWRDATLLVAVLAAIYLMVSLLGLARLRRRRVPVAAATATASTAGQAAPAVVPLTTAEPMVATDADVPTDIAPVPSVAFAVELSAQVAKTELEVEVRQLRVELAALRDELAEIKATRRVSPLYAEAAALAQRGFDARGVAEECGISVAEAELVLAMSRDSRDFDIEVDDDAERH
jgi:hypothetical protein